MAGGLAGCSSPARAAAGGTSVESWAFALSGAVPGCAGAPGLAVAKGILPRVVSAAASKLTHNGMEIGNGKEDGITREPLSFFGYLLQFDANEYPAAI
jgi:hypothetical protein